MESESIVDRQTIGWTLTLVLAGSELGPARGEIEVDVYLDGDVAPVQRVSLYRRELVDVGRPFCAMQEPNSPLVVAAVALGKALFDVAEDARPS